MSKVGVVVGHGKSPVGKGWGERIDKCDVVMRMWDWYWQKPNPQDWGVKYTFGLIETLAFSMNQFWEHNHDKPEICWVASKRPEWPKPLMLPIPNNVVDSDRYERIGKRSGARGITGNFKIQRGTVGAAWMLEQPAMTEVILIGFDNAYAGVALKIADGYPKEYVNLPSTYPFKDYEKYADKRSTKYGNHDYAAERPLLERIAKQAGVKLSFAEDVWADGSGISG